MLRCFQHISTLVTHVALVMTRQREFRRLIDCLSIFDGTFMVKLLILRDMMPHGFDEFLTMPWAVGPGEGLQSASPRGSAIGHGGCIHVAGRSWKNLCVSKGFHLRFFKILCESLVWNVSRYKSSS